MLQNDGYGTDMALMDIMKKRSRTNPPNLKYLELADPTVYGMTYGYSEEMLQALGIRDNVVPRGTFNKGSVSGAPWAGLPHELHEPIRSLYGVDFDPKKQLPPLTKDEIQRIKNTVAEKREAARVKAVTSGAIFKRAARAPPITPGPDGTIKWFDHHGITRARSVPLEEQIGNIGLPPKGDPPDAIPEIQNPLLGGESLFVATPRGKVRKEIEKDEIGQEKLRRVKYNGVNFSVRYPKDRQLLKHRVLEEQRMTQGKQNLTTHGWAETTNPGGRDKTSFHPERVTTLSPEEERKVEEEILMYLKEKEAQKLALQAKRSILEDAANEPVAGGEILRNCKKKTSEVSPFPRAEGVPSSAAIATSEAPVAGVKYPPVEALPQPDQYRAELPAGRLPPKFMMVPKKTGLPSVCPPWGRQNELEVQLEDRWAKIRIFNTRLKQQRCEAVTKLQIDHELRIVRDKGLMKKEKKSLLKTMDPRQLEYIKKLPDTSALRAQNLQPMKAAPRIVGATLK